MNPDGMVALLNYREDGITRENSPFPLVFGSNATFFSLFYLLETWP